MANDVPLGVTEPSSVSFMAGSASPPAHQDLNKDELAIFDVDLKRLASIYSSFGQKIGDIWLEDRDTLLWACSIARKQLDVTFRGLKALGSSSFGMQPIRPRYINATQTWIVN